MKIGSTKRENDVFIGRNAINRHMVVIGKSGSGKTTKIIKLIERMATNGEITVVINWRNTLNRQMVDTKLMKLYERYAVVFDVAKEGIGLPLFTPLEIGNGEKESEKAVIQRVSSMLKNAVGLSRTQEDITLSAVKDIYRLNLYAEEGLSAITKWLRVQEKAVADNAAGKLRCLCDMGLFYDGDFWEETGKIYEFDLNGLEYDDQLVVVKFLLDYLLRIASKGCFLRKGLNIFIDEVQNLDFSDGSTISTLVNESRKLNVHMLMAAPSFGTSAKKGMEVLTQCGTQLFFEPLNTDRKMMAQLIAPRDYERWVFALTRLKRGECIACGNFSIKNDENVTVPIELRADRLDE